MGVWSLTGLNRGASPAVTLAAMVLVLIAPAIVNGFPLVFPDTGAYLGIAYGQEWTIDRAGFYGLMLKPAALPGNAEFGIWAVLILQAAIIAAVLLSACRQLIPGGSRLLPALVVAALAAVTSLPWHSAQLMPDAFTGPLVLLTFIAVTRDPLAPGSPLMWLGVTFLVLLHWTHSGIMLAAATAALAGQALLGSSLRLVGRKVVAIGVCLAIATAAHVTANGLTFNRWSVAPMGPVFLYARLTEDGLVPRWLDGHCGRDAPRELCDMRHSMPRDSQVLLWGGEASPLHPHIGSDAPDEERWAWVDMMEQAAWGSVREQPVAFAAKALNGAAAQFMHFDPLDDECPEVCAAPSSALMNRLQHYRPALVPVLRSSLQLQGKFPKSLIRAINRPIALAGLLLLIPVMLIAWRRRDDKILALSLAVTFALIANAALAGALSDVHDRYQSRLIWLAPFVALLAWLRWRKGRRSDSEAAPR